MRAFTLVLGLLTYSLCSPSLASTKVYPVEEFLHVHFEGEDAQALLNSLNLPEGQTSGGPGKTFSTSDNSVELSCFKRHYNVVAHACEVVFDLRGFSKTIRVKNEKAGMRIELVDSESNETLYKALNVAGSFENGDNPKSFENADDRFRIECSGNRVCSFFVDLN
jgi:hypothetical protein